MSLMTDYIRLREDGYDAFGAGVELKLSEVVAEAFDWAWRNAGGKPTAAKPRDRSHLPSRKYQSPRGPAIAPSLAPADFDERDSRYFQAVRAAGGYPRGEGGHWVGADGLPWCPA